MQSPLVSIQLTALLIILTPIADAEDFRTQLISSAEAFLQKKAEQTARDMNADQFQVRIQPLAEHTRLPLCKTALEIKDFSQSLYGEQILQAVCKDHWKRLMKARILIYLPVIVSTGTITMKKPVTEQDIQWQSRDISVLQQSYLTRPEQVLGKYVKSTVKAGTPLNHSLLHCSAYRPD